MNAGVSVFIVGVYGSENQTSELGDSTVVVSAWSCNHRETGNYIHMVLWEDVSAAAKKWLLQQWLPQDHRKQRMSL